MVSIIRKWDLVVFVFFIRFSKFVRIQDMRLHIWKFSVYMRTLDDWIMNYGPTKVQKTQSSRVFRAFSHIFSKSTRIKIINVKFLGFISSIRKLNGWITNIRPNLNKK